MCAREAKRFGTPAAAQDRKPSASIDWAAESDKCIARITPEQVAQLAAGLSVTPESLRMVGCGRAERTDLDRWRASGAGWHDDPPAGAFTFPERDGGGRIVGLSLRAPDGRKGSPAGARRGLIVPSTLNSCNNIILVVEGMSDVAAAETLGLAAVGRPSNAGGADDLSKLLDSREVLVVGENDQKPSGAWPGRDGAKLIAKRLGAEWGEPVKRSLPPDGTKDVRSWLQSRVKTGLDLSNEAACKAAGAEVLAELQANAREVKPEKVSQAEALVRLAGELYRVGLSVEGEPFAVPHDGPNIALMFKGSREALRASLSNEFRKRTGKTPGAGALGDALTALQGGALECEPEPVQLRLAAHEGGIVIDLGAASGRAVVVMPSGWEVVDRSPIVFRRTALSAPLPEPTHGDGIGALRGLVNVDDESWPLLLAFIVAALLPDIPHPILMLGGQQGAGKSTLARTIGGVIDPSTAPLRSQPADVEQWAIAAAGSWLVCIDNVSAIFGWWSDALCKVVTGDGWIRRKLYTDGDLAVLSFKRVVILTSIDAGALRGDLADRLLVLDLSPIKGRRRRTERELDAVLEQERPAIFGAILDLLSRVLARLDSVALPELPRMADFARVVAAVDAELGTNAHQTYLSQRDRLCADVIEADPVAVAVVALIEKDGEFVGAAGALLERIKPDHPGRDWPKNPRGLSGRMRRLIPALATVGIEAVAPSEHDKGRIWRIGRFDPAVEADRPADRPTQDAPSFPTIPGSSIGPVGPGGLGGPNAALSNDAMNSEPTGADAAGKPWPLAGLNGPVPMTTADPADVAIAQAVLGQGARP